MKITNFGRYEVRRIIGRGGMARVFLAYDPLMTRDVAIKVLPSHLTADQKFFGLFQREVKTISQLEHPCIVPVYDYGEHESEPYIVMRYLSGGSLHNRLAKTQLNLTELAAIVARIARALDYAHSKRTIHRDLKPGNILFDDENQPYLSDFGIAKVVDSSSSLTGSGIGTPTYMSPEQAIGSGKLDGRSDIYSLGVIIFEALTGQVPYTADNPVALSLKKIQGDIPDIIGLNPDLPSDCALVIQRALAKTLDQRYKKAAHLATDLNTIARKLPLPERPELREHRTEPLGPLDPPTSPSPSPPDKDKQTEKQIMWWQRRPVLFSGIAVVIIGLITIIGILTGIMGPSSTPTPSPGMFAIEGEDQSQPEEEMAMGEEESPAKEEAVSNISESEEFPTDEPSVAPTDEVIDELLNVTVEPTAEITTEPTAEPTVEPTEEPTTEPTEEPVIQPISPPRPNISGLLAIPLLFGNEPKVYIVNTNGEVQGSLGFARQPDYTKDGTQLVVNGDGPGGSLLLQVSNAVGANVRDIGDRGLIGHSHPAWSPDGTQVIYNDNTLGGADYRLFRRSLDSTSGEGEEITSIGQISHPNPLYPQWTTQDRFVFRGCDSWASGGNCGLWVVEGQGGQPNQLTRNFNHIPTDVSNNILLYSSNEAGDWNVYKLDISSGQNEQLTFNPAADGLGTISPDSLSVAFLSNRDGKLAVWYVSINGDIAEKMFDINPSWGVLRADGWTEEKLTWGPG